MVSRLSILAGTLALVLSGCQSGVDVGGEWDITLGIAASDGGLDPNLTGRLQLRQVLSSIEGEGVVSTANDTCEVQFSVQGAAYDPYHVPVLFDFSGSNCESASLEDITLNLVLLDEGRVLYGHGNYSSGETLYVSASLAPF